MAPIRKYDVTMAVAGADFEERSGCDDKRHVLRSSLYESFLNTQRAPGTRGTSHKSSPDSQEEKSHIVNPSSSTQETT